LIAAHKTATYRSFRSLNWQHRSYRQATTELGSGIPASVVAPWCFCREGATSNESQIERRRYHQRAVNTLGHASDQRMIETRKFLVSRQCLPALALILSLVALGTTTAHAETVTVTGANGTPSPAAPIPGGVGSDATASAGPGPGPDASNAASASGGNGGEGFVACSTFPISFCFVETPGGNGGNATANATTAITAGAGSAFSNAYGGTGGNGSAGGNGGNATSSATTTSVGGANAFSCTESEDFSR
jgi:hypothetical protein